VVVIALILWTTLILCLPWALGVSYDEGDLHGYIRGYNDGFRAGRNAEDRHHVSGFPEPKVGYRDAVPGSTDAPSES